MTKFQLKSLFLAPVFGAIIGLYALLVCLLHPRHARAFLDDVFARMKREQTVWERWLRRYGEASE